MVSIACLKRWFASKKWLTLQKWFASIKWFAALLIISFLPAGTFAQQPVKLLVRADDMGGTYDIGLAIIKAYREGIVTSASLMPTSAFFEEAVQLCRENPGLAAGIHVTLFGSRKRPVLSPAEVPSLVTGKGYFYESTGQLDSLNVQFDPDEVEREIRAQIGKARASGLDFVYLDYHRGVPDFVDSLILDLCREQKLVYGQDKAGIIYGYPRTRFAPEQWFYQVLPDGQIVYYAAPAFNEDQKKQFYDALNSLEPGGWTVVVHPGLDVPQKASITELMCAPETKEIIKNKNIQLVSYHDLWEEEYGKPWHGNPSNH
jgi:predicted glycoside hydrolase/deacetylase ChbG (UPF0249 family)